jgi:vitamin B12 transporter
MLLVKALRVFVLCRSENGKMMRKVKLAVIQFLAFAAMLLGGRFFVFAGDVDLEKIVVTPSRYEESIAGTASTVTVFNGRDLEEAKFQGDNLKDSITEVPGLDVVQAGSFGSPVSVFSRGTNSGQTQIMIDNVRVYDPIATNGAFDLAHLSLNNLERIEVVNGPQSVLYGSDAMGGVINILTKKGAGKPTVSFLSSGGTYNSFKEELESNGKIGSFAYSFGVARFDTRGISKLKDTSERDPYENTSVSVRVDYDLDFQNTIGLIGRFTDTRFEYDDSIGLRDDRNLNGKEKQISMSSYFENKINDYWGQKLQLSYMGNYRRDADDKDPQFPLNYLRDWYTGENYQLDWQHTIKLATFDTFIAGFDYQRESGSYYYYSETPYGPFEAVFPEVTSNTKGYYLQNLINIEDIFHFNFGTRINDHSNAGFHQVYKVDANYFFKTGTKIKGGWGTAFKAPTLYQLYAVADPFYGGGGNPNLKPEESSTYEIGIEQSVFDEKINFGFTYFHTDISGLIDAVYNPSTYFTENYANVGKARVFGYESILTVKPIKELKFDFGYTWQDTENRDTGKELLRRPKNKCYSKIRYNPIDKLQFGLKFIYNGKRSDSGDQVLKDYVRIDLDASYKINPNAQIFAAIGNITAKSYEEIKNYAQPGRVFSGGLKFTF